MSWNTKAKYKRHKYEVKRTSKMLEQAPKNQGVVHLNFKMPYGSLKGQTIREIIDRSYKYWKAIEDKMNFGEDVRTYAREIEEKIQKYSEPLKYSVSMDNEDSPPWNEEAPKENIMEKDHIGILKDLKEVLGEYVERKLIQGVTKLEVKYENVGGCVVPNIKIKFK